jgi:hypothetical protein
MVNRCYMCKRSGESVDHLLLHCGVTSALFNALLLALVCLGLCLEVLSNCLLVGGRLEG